MKKANSRMKPLCEPGGSSKSSVGGYGKVHCHKEAMQFEPLSMERNIDTCCSNRQNRTTSFPQDRLRDAAEPQLLKASPAMRPHYNQLRSCAFCDLQDLILWDTHAESRFSRNAFALGDKSHAAEFEQRLGLQRPE
jgi:hypothetical protein